MTEQSVAQDMRRCEKCGEEKPLTPEHFKNTGSGNFRAKCRACCQAEDRKRWHKRNLPKQANMAVKPEPVVEVAPQPSRSLVPSRVGLVTIPGGEVRGAVVESEGWVRVSDVCERLGIAENGQIEGLKNNPTFRSYLSLIAEGRGRPAWYIRGDQVPGWVQTINPQKVKPEVRDALTWLQGEFNKVLHAWVTGGEIPASPAMGPMPSNVRSLNTPHALDANAFLEYLIEAVAEKAANKVAQRFDERLGPMPQQVAETHATVKGATRIEIVQEITVDGWPSDGHWYIAVNERDGIMSLGETTKDPPVVRLDDGDYNGNKAGDRCWVMIHSVRTDKRKEAQTWIQRMARQFGARHLSGDRYAYDPEFVREARRIVGPVKVEAMKQQAADDNLFLPPLFRQVA